MAGRDLISSCAKALRSSRNSKEYRKFPAFLYVLQPLPPHSGKFGLLFKRNITVRMCVPVVGLSSVEATSFGVDIFKNLHKWILLCFSCKQGAFWLRRTCKGGNGRLPWRGGDPRSCRLSLSLTFSRSRQLPNMLSVSSQETRRLVPRCGNLRLGRAATNPPPLELIFLGVS